MFKLLGKLSETQKSGQVIENGCESLVSERELELQVTQEDEKKEA